MEINIILLSTSFFIAGFLVGKFLFGGSRLSKLKEKEARLISEIESLSHTINVYYPISSYDVRKLEEARSELGFLQYKIQQVNEKCQRRK